jgi:RNA polymerase sigma-70 factor, ECF subfamily
MRLRFARQENGQPDVLRGFVQRLVGREESAWKEFVDEFAPRMSTLFRREFSCDASCSEDLTAECFQRIAQAISRFNYRTEQQFKAWVFTIARNVGYDYVRRMPAECPLPDHLQQVLSSSTPDDPEIVAGVSSAMDRLSPTSRKAVEMRYFQGLDAQEIARALNTTYGATRVCLHRALKQLELILGSDKRILRRLRK